MHKNEDQVRDNIDTCDHEAPCTHPLFFFSPSAISYIRIILQIVTDYKFGREKYREGNAPAPIMWK